MEKHIREVCVSQAVNECVYVSAMSKWYWETIEVACAVCVCVSVIPIPANRQRRQSRRGHSR